MNNALLQSCREHYHKVVLPKQMVWVLSNFTQQGKGLWSQWVGPKAVGAYLARFTEDEQAYIKAPYTAS